MLCGAQPVGGRAPRLLSLSRSDILPQCASLRPPRPCAGRARRNLPSCDMLRAWIRSSRRLRGQTWESTLAGTDTCRIAAPGCGAQWEGGVQLDQRPWTHKRAQRWPCTRKQSSSDQLRLEAFAAQAGCVRRGARRPEPSAATGTRQAACMRSRSLLLGAGGRAGPPSSARPDQLRAHVALAAPQHVHEGQRAWAGAV